METPFSLHVFPSYYCNFKCRYCIHALTEKDLKERNFKRELMDFDVFKMAIDGAVEFPEKLKALIFAGHGEPLFHKEIGRMVGYVKKADIANQVEIVTNGTFLSNRADDLIKGGLDSLRVSVQGLTDEMYETVSGTKYKVMDLLDSLRYFYKNRRGTRVHVKIINTALVESDDEKCFHEMFGPVSDSTEVEYLIPFIREIDYTEIDCKLGKCKHGHNKAESNICSMPFYMMVLEPNGNVVPCCSTEVPFVYGNVKNSSLKAIWNSTQVKNFQRLQLTDMHKNKVCGACSVPQYGLQPGDYLDHAREKLLAAYESL